jgi:hypothetical protein
MKKIASGYRTVRGDDVIRAGKFLDLVDENTGNEVAEVFYSDTTHQMTLSVFRQGLPLHIVELLAERAKHALPPPED